MIYKITLKTGKTMLMDAKNEKDVRITMVASSRIGIAVLDQIEKIEIAETQVVEN